jgi:lysyl-tRNA synthetase class 2
MDFTEACCATPPRRHRHARLTYAGKPVRLDEPFARLSVRDSLVSTPA